MRDSMKKRLSVGTLTVALLTLGFWTVQGWDTVPSTGSPLYRHSADFKNFDNTETFSFTGVYPDSKGSLPGDDGTVVYQKEVWIPDDHNVLYVTFSATGDTHDGAALWLNCRVDKSDCNPGAGGAAGAHPGYVALQKMPSPVLGSNCNDGGGGFGDCHDNNINYTWCTPIYGGTHLVELRMATSISGAPVFFEAAHFYIDSNNIQGNDCEQAAPVEEANGVLVVPSSPLPEVPSDPLPDLPAL